jgi:hypothetical protein
MIAKFSAVSLPENLHKSGSSIDAGKSRETINPFTFIKRQILCHIRNRWKKALLIAVSRSAPGAETENPTRPDPETRGGIEDFFGDCMRERRNQRERQ